MTTDAATASPQHMLAKFYDEAREIAERTALSAVEAGRVIRGLLAHTALLTETLRNAQSDTILKDADIRGLTLQLAQMRETLGASDDASAETQARLLMNQGKKDRERIRDLEAALARIAAKANNAADALEKLNVKAARRAIAEPLMKVGEIYQIALAVGDPRA